MLVVEDDPSQRRSLTLTLESRGYRVESVGTGREALERTELLAPQLVLLDLGLPDMHGLDVCRHLRLATDCPIIVVSAESDDERIVEALDRGANDYVTKPFAVDVLAARMRVALRHHAAVEPVLRQARIVGGDVEVDLDGLQVFIGGVPVECYAKHVQLLARFLRNQGKVLTYAMLLRGDGGTGSADADLNALRISVSRIRRVLGTGPRRPLIHTEHRIGYRLTVPDG